MLVGVVLVCLTLLGGCKPSRQEVIASITRAESRAGESYYGTDLEVAARDLVSYQQELLIRRKQVDDAYRYDYALGLACGRLALIYESSGQTNQASAQMRESLSYFQRESLTHHLNESDITEQSTRQFIARLDEKRKPVWQKQ